MRPSSRSGLDYLPHPIPPHPRLMAGAGDFERLKSQIQSDGISGELYACLLRRAGQLLTESPAERVMTGRRLLHVSRLVLSRISVLSLVARISGERRYARRAVDEALAACAFSDWNPSHFLDTAEMSLAVAIAYDWLFDDLSEAEKETIATALLEKGILPSKTHCEHWVSGHNNWNQVCHAGISAAAVAVADLHPELAEEMLRRAQENISFAAAAYAPDGAYPEGPMYWSYGTTFHVILADVFRGFFGETKGVDEYPGFDKSAEYIAHMTAPSGRYFSYSDSRAGRGLALPLFWMARQFQHPEWLRFDIEQMGGYLGGYDEDVKGEHYRVLALALLWWQPQVERTGPPPLSWHAGGRSSVAVFRTSHDDPKALYVAMKGGGATLSHAHMDAGGFVLEADGERWACDLGMQEYESLESLGVKLWDGWSQEGERWKIFRLGPDSHNILRFDGEPQKLDGFAKLTSFHPNRFCVYDLTELHEQVKAAARGLQLIENKAVLFQDEWTARENPIEVTWQMLTTARALIEGNSVLLSQNGETLRLVVCEPEAVAITYTDVSAPREHYDAENPNAGMIHITARTEPHQHGRFRILAIPGSAGDVAAPELKPLRDW